MALYENVFIARQDVPQTQVETLTKQFTDLVAAQGGTVSKNEYWGLRSLTFRMLAGANHALSDQASQDAYTAVLTKWLSEMLVGERRTEATEGKGVRQTAAECGGAPVFRANLESVTEIRDLFDRVARHFGRIDGLVNNAARFTRFDPLEITAVTGSYDVGGWENSLTILVSEDNPLKCISMEQLDAVFGAARDGGWAGTNWRSDWARGPEKNIRTWSQLGLTGDWADKPINMYGFSIRYNTATDFSDKVLKSSDKWNENIHAYGNIVNPDGSRYIEADQITDNLGKDRYGIAYNRYRGDRPKVKRLAVAAAGSKTCVEHTIENIQKRTYPLYNEQYFYTSVKPGTAMDPKVKEFLRYVLSQEGQADVMRDGKYLPLTADVVREQLKKLD